MTVSPFSSLRGNPSPPISISPPPNSPAPNSRRNSLTPSPFHCLFEIGEKLDSLKDLPFEEALIVFQEAKDLFEEIGFPNSFDERELIRLAAEKEQISNRIYNIEKELRKAQQGLWTRV